MEWLINLRKLRWIALAISALYLGGHAGLARADGQARETGVSDVGSHVHEAADLSSQLFKIDSPQYNAAFRKALTVLSHTPANIGPYSAAVAAAITAKVSPADHDPRYTSRLQSLLAEKQGKNEVPFVFNAVPELDPSANNAVFVQGNSDFCTGVAVSNTLILTAAHCACENMQSIGIGTNERGQMVFKNVTGSPLLMKSCQARTDTDPDVSLLMTDPLGPSVSPARLADTTMINSAGSGRLIGFGYSEPGPNEDTSWGDRRYAAIPIVSAACTGSINGQPDATYYGCISGQEIVAVSPARSDQCHGDSGAPLFLDQGSGTQYVLGIASRAIKDGDCGDGGIYERVDGAVGAWISAQIAKFSN